MISAFLGLVASADAATFGVDSTADSGEGTLRDAILAANANPGADRVIFFPNVTGAITLTSGELIIGDDLTIEGPGAKVLTISGNNSSRILQINAGVVHLSELTLTDGQVTGGGGAILASSNLTLSNAVVSGNTAQGSSGDGGGIDAQALLELDSSTVSGNTAQGGSGNGGGIFGDSGGVIFTENSTVSGNQAAGMGGGIFSAGQFGIENSTITGNELNPGCCTGGGGINSFGSATHTIANSIVAGNISPTLIGHPDLYASTGSVDAAFSLIEDPTGTTVNDTVGGSDLTGIDPILGPLTDNGGPTPTELPAFNSPVIDKGKTAGGQTTDQRSASRPVDLPAVPNSGATGADGADMGAVELTPAEATPPSVPQPPPSTAQPPSSVAPQPTGERSRALKKCKKRHAAKARKKCRKRAQLLPV